MRVAVIGAGIVGVTTAYELAVDGHEVTVFERQASVAAETSFANAGVLAPGYVTPRCGWRVHSRLRCSVGPGAGGAPAARACIERTAVA